MERKVISGVVTKVFSVL